MFDSSIMIAEQFSMDEHAVLFHGNCLDCSKRYQIKAYNWSSLHPRTTSGKEYEKK